MRSLAAVVVLGVALTGQVAEAGVYNFHPTPSDLGELTHQKAYLWGITPNLPDDDVVTAASLLFHNIRDWQVESNDLWATLIDSAPQPLVTYTDNEAPSNYFSAWGTPLVHYTNISTIPHDLLYTFTAGQVTTLNTYLADGNFGIGIDPDCHFYNCGITLTLATQPGGGGEDQPPIPEPAAGSILLGTIGAILARRKRR